METGLTGFLAELSQEERCFCVRSISMVEPQCHDGIAQFPSPLPGCVVRIPTGLADEHHVGKHEAHVDVVQYLALIAKAQATLGRFLHAF